MARLSQDEPPSIEYCNRTLSDGLSAASQSLLVPLLPSLNTNSISKAFVVSMSPVTSCLDVFPLNDNELGPIIQY